jgi:hypothetical protein
MVGISDEEIRRVAEGPEAAGWDPLDALVLKVANVLHSEQVISDGTWEALGERFDAKQKMDLVFTVGQYTLVSMTLNTLGVQREPGVEGFPI